MKHLLLSAAVALAAVTSAQAENKKLTIAQASEGMIYTPIYVARGMGYFAEEGIDAEVVVLHGGSQATAALISGDADVQIGDPTTAITARQKGADLILIGAALQQFGSNLVIQGEIADNLGLTEATSVEDRIKALKGLTIGITAPGGTPDKLIRNMIASVGMDADRDVTLVPLGSAGPMLAAFAQKRIDAFILSSPTSDIAVMKNGAKMLVNLSAGEYAALNGFPQLTLVALEGWTEANPDLATGYVKAVGRAEELIANDPAAASAAMREFFPDIEQDVFDAAFASNAGSFAPNPRLTDEAVQHIFDFMESGGTKVTLPISEVYTNVFVEAAGY